MEEIASAFIFDSCQLLPKSSNAAIYFPKGYSRDCGSAMEFYIRPLNSCITDVDALLFSTEELAFTEDFPVLPQDMSGLSDTIRCYKIEPYLRYPGFVRLCGLGILNYNWRQKEYEFSNRAFPDRHHAYGACDIVSEAIHIGPMNGIANTVRGPAITMNLGFEMLDVVKCMWCPQWPVEAKGWLKRTRGYGWPTIETISEVVRNGCFFVYSQHRSCRNDMQQWRYSFSVAEIILLQSWNKIQQIVYHLLRIFAKRELIQKDCPKEEEVLCTYHLKTLMLWTCEQLPPEWWHSSSVIAICCELLQKLSDWLSRRFCPNYFIFEANLFHAESNSTMFDKTQRKLNEFSNSKILSEWFIEHYIHPFIQTVFKCGNLELSKASPQFVDYLQPFLIIRKTLEKQSLEVLFFHGFLCSNLGCRMAIESEGLHSRYGLRPLSLQRNTFLLTHSRMDALPIPENVGCFTHLDSAVFCLNVAYGLGSGKISWKSEVFIEFVKELSLKRNIVTYQYYSYPEIQVAKTGSQFQFLRAQIFLEHLNGSDSNLEFQLVFLTSKAFLKEALILASQSDDSESDIIVPATLVYLAGLHFAASQYQTVIDLCSPVLQEPPVFFESETLNAGCLFFIDDVARIVGLYLLSIIEHVRFNKRQIYLDLRLAPKLFAYYLTIISTERMSKQLELNFELPTPSFPLDYFIAVSAKRKFSTPMQSCTSLKVVRQCVYRRTVSEAANATSGEHHFPIEEKMVDALFEYALEKLISFYGVICIKCDTVSCYRALYLYKCRQYCAVLHLCEVILHQPDLQNDLKQYAYSNVQLLPPFDTFFDSDAQCLLGLHTLVWYLSPVNEEPWKCDIATESTFAHVFSHYVYFKNQPLSISLGYPYPVNCHYSLGGHFLAMYLKLRCLIENEQPWIDVMYEFAATKRTRPFEHIIHQFVLKKLCKNRSNSRLSSRQ